MLKITYLTNERSRSLPPHISACYEPTDACGEETTVHVSWSTLIPVEASFHLDKTHVHYHLYEQCLDYLRTAFTSSSSTCQSLNKHKPLHEWPQSLGTLVNCLADRYRAPLKSEGQAESHLVLSPDAVLDYILAGMVHVWTYPTLNPATKYYHVSCLLREQIDGESDPSLLCRAVFLDVITPLWTKECRARTYQSWSPMPWSRASSLELVTLAQPPLVINAADLPSEADYVDHNWESMYRQAQMIFGSPSEIPWLGSTHNGHPLSTTLSSYVQRRRNSYAPSLRGDAALWVGALTFGVLEACMGMNIPESLLSRASEDGQHVLAEKLLGELLFNWHLYISSTFDVPDLDPARLIAYLQQGAYVANVLRRALLAIDEEGLNDCSVLRRAGYDANTAMDILSSVALTVVVLCGHAVSIWGDLLPEVANLSTVLADSSRYFNGYIVQSCKRRLLGAGWCPNTISDGFFIFLSLPVVSNLVRLSPYIRKSKDEHRACTEEACVYYTITDTAGYKAQHLPECTCSAGSVIATPAGEVEDLLSQGFIPAVVYEDGRLTVCKAADVPYVAISHVWADGLGSTTEEGLPPCQVSRLAALVRQLVPSSGAFWMDSLCVPARRDLRKKAIKLMARTYQDAAKVLVTDACIRTQCTQSTPWADVLSRIATSGWVRRVWTLQEGLLARELHFEFADGLVDAEALQSSGSGGLAQWFYRPYLPLLAYRADAAELYVAEQRVYAYTLEDIVALLGLRTTSKPEDETVAIASLLPAADVGVLLEISGEHAAERRMASFLLQLKELPRRWPMLCDSKLSLLGFRWAPRSLAEVRDVTNGAFGTGTCTEDGFSAEYAIGRLGEPLPIPNEYTDGSKEWFEFLVAYHPSQSTYAAQFLVGGRPFSAGHPTTITAFVFIEEELPEDAKCIMCAAVFEHASDVEGDAPIRCEFVVAGRLFRAGYNPADAVASCRASLGNLASAQLLLT